MQSNKKESLLSQRGQMAFWAIGIWAFLAAWSLSAFWQHIDTLQPTYKFAAKCGAAGGEFALLALIVLHCFNKHIGVRKWALILGCALAVIIVGHSGALRGVAEAQSVQVDTEKRLADHLTEMSRKQAEGVKSVDTGTQRERLAKNREAVRQQAEIAKSAQKEVAEAIKGSAEKVKDAAIVPRWYLDGWMYIVIFAASVLFSGVVFSKMMNKEDIDEDFDGVADHLQKEQSVHWPSQVGK
jgi:hypothetical protein